MKKNALGFLLILIVSTSLTCHAQGTKLSRISVKGNKFVTAEGAPIVFRGLNTSDPNKLANEGRWNKGYFLR